MSILDDNRYMNMAVDLALKGKGHTYPNPVVGAVVVKSNRVIGRGFHRYFGGPHAEVEAIYDGGRDIVGSTLYVTMEPCCHYGKTPPCSEFISNIFIKQVVIGMKDPNPLVNGRGIRRLRQHGITVSVGILSERCKEINEIYAEYIKRERPFVILKMAMSLDGKAATSAGISKWITNKTARQYVHNLRAEVDAILVGIGTVLKDNPKLTIRKKGINRPIKKIIVDSELCISILDNLNIFKYGSPSDIIVATKKLSFDDKRARSLIEKGVTILPVKEKDNKVDLTDLVEQVNDLGITSILIEGGPKIATSAIEADIVDKAIFIIGNKIIGGKEGMAVFEGQESTKLEHAMRLSKFKVVELGDNVAIEGYIRKNKIL